MVAAMAELSPKARRAEVRERLRREIFDLVIVGGGITGVSIARDAALRGYAVALLEQDDFASGTSSRSSRLVHGGLRYLEHGEVRLVFESVSERSRLAKNARHIVRPLPFVFPVYKGQLELMTMDMGLWIYDALALFRNYRSHEHLSPLATQDVVPGIRQAGLQGSVLYFDYQTDDARLVLENVLSAERAGASLISYCRVLDIESDRAGVRTLHTRDLVLEQGFGLPAAPSSARGPDFAQFAVRGRVLVLAAGPWTDEILGLARVGERWLRPTKGIHVVVPREKLPIEAALVMRHPDDRRILFALPYFERTVIGTTDTDFSGDPGQVNATAADVRYLVETARHYFPDAGLGAKDVISTWAGVRPLLHQDEAADPGSVSREHRIEARADGLVIIAGGKLTTYRRMATECVDTALRALAARGGRPAARRAPTHRFALPGAEGIAADADLEALALALERAFPAAGCARHLAYTYGARAQGIAAIAEADPEAARPIVEGLPFCWAEISFATRAEHALTLADALVRRTQVFYRDRDQGLVIAERAAARMARELDWEVEEQRCQVRRYRELVAANRAWRSS
jgi:glycerol-3-phosphate dehydrogenase